MLTNKKLITLVLFFIVIPFLQLRCQNEHSMAQAQTNPTESSSTPTAQQNNLFTQKIEDFVSPEDKVKTPVSIENNKEEIKQEPENIAPENSATTLSDETKPEQIQTEETTKKQEQKNESGETKDIYLNFENSELTSFINYMAELKKINLVPDKTLQGVKCSLTIRTPLSVDGAWKVFLTVLEMGGFSIVQKGDVQVIIPKAQKTKQPLPAYINVPAETLPDSDINLRYVTFLQNIGVGEIQDLLKGMLSPEGTVLTYPEVNGLIITDKSYNIKAAMKVINELDQTGLQEAVEVIKLQNANAVDVKKTFEDLIQKPETNPLMRLLGKQAESSLEYFSPTTRIIAEERTNSLILLGNRKSIQKIEDFIVKYLDTELKGVTSPLHIYELQNTDAESIKTILEAVAAPVEEKAKYGAVRGGVKYFKKMNFQVDKDGNRLLVSSTDQQDWELLKRTINDLDKPQPQVAIETLIVAVNLSDVKELGGSLRNKFMGQIGKGVNFQAPTFNGTVVKSSDSNNLLGNMLDGVTGGLGSTILSFGKDTNIWGIFKALKSQVNTSVLSQPFFTAVNNQKAHLKIGETLNVVNETTESKFEGYIERTAYLTLDVTPQINIDGIVRLKIDTTIENFTDTSLGNKDIKKLTTDVSVADGQVLALGGFIKTKVDESENKTPILGDIPLLGWMFKNKKRDVTKSYIFIFMSPTIVKPRTVPGSNLYTRMKLHDATDYIERAVETKKTKDPISNWFFNPQGENYSHKVVDFANARYQPTTVDIKNDPYYRATPKNGLNKIKKENFSEILEKSEEDALVNQEKKDLKEFLSKKPIISQKEKKDIPETSANIEKKEKLKEFIFEQPQIKKEAEKLEVSKLEIPQNTSSQSTITRKLKSRRQG